MRKLTVKSEDKAACKDNSGGAAQMVPAMYDELRRLARFYLSRERGNHTLEPTALTSVGAIERDIRKT